MKQVFANLKRRIENNLIFIFLLFSAKSVEVFVLLKEIYQKMKLTITEPQTKAVWELICNFNWVDFCTQFIIILALYLILKRYVKIKNGLGVMVTEINDGFTQITDNVYKSESILNTKIRYVDFRITNKDLDNDKYLQKLHSEGFSKEDLIEIGVDEKFLEQNKDKLLPRTVIEKYKEFKFELEKHNKEKKNGKE